MSIKILGTIDKVTAKDGRVIQQAGDTDGVVASFYDLSGNPSLFLDGTQARLGNVGVKTATPNEALTVVGNVSSTGLISQQKNHCVAALSANQAITQSDTRIEFHDKDDPNNWWNSANHTFQPTVAGYYNVVVMVNWQGSNSEVQVNNQLRKNGNTIALSQMPIPKTLTHSLLIQAITFMNGSSDYVDCSGYTGANTNITGEANGNWTKFEAFKIS